MTDAKRTDAGPLDAGLSGASVELRPATLDDADLLLAWANDPAARAASLTRAPIARPTHVAWLAARLAAPTCRIWIGSTGGVPRGVVRFEIDADGRAVVSIAVDVAARGHGIGRGLLREGLVAARSELRPAGFRAWVRADNAASIALFGSAGFARSAAIPSAAVDAPLELLLDDR